MVLILSTALYMRLIYQCRPTCARRAGQAEPVRHTHALGVSCTHRYSEQDTDTPGMLLYTGHSDTHEQFENGNEKRCFSQLRGWSDVGPANPVQCT